MTAGLLDLGGRPLKSKWTHVLTTDLDVTIQAQTGTWDPATTYTWEFAASGTYVGLVVTGTLSESNTALTFYEPAATIDLAPSGIGFSLFTSSPRLCWAMGTLVVVAWATAQSSVYGSAEYDLSEYGS